IPGTIASFAAGCRRVPGSSELAGSLAGTRGTPTEIRGRITSARFASRDGIQDAEVRDLQQSAVAIHATCGESRDLSSRADNHHVAAAWRAADFDGLDALLSRASGGGRRLERLFLFVETIRTIAWMKERARAARADGRIVGLVPTMGALHNGHMALFKRARAECAPVYASVFVNPKQFGPTEDFEKYPRALEADLAKLEAAGVEAVFAPEP